MRARRYGRSGSKGMMQLFDGRPKDMSGRLDKEARVYDLLDKLAMWYQRVDHNPADTMEVCNEIDTVLEI